MSAKAKISKIASLWYTTTIATAVVSYFAVENSSLTGTAFGLAVSLAFSFVVHRLLLGGSGVVRKLVLIYNLLGMGLLGIGVAFSAFSITSAPLRAIMAIAWMGWNFLLHFRSFSTLKDSDVKRNFS